MALCACRSQMELGSPARHGGHISTCTGNTGPGSGREDHLPFCVGRWELHIPEGQSRDTDLVLPCGKHRNGAQPKVEKKGRIWPHMGKGNLTGRGGQYVKTYNKNPEKNPEKKKKIVLINKQNSPWHLITSETDNCTVKCACGYPHPCTWGYNASMCSFFDSTLKFIT